MIKVFKDLVKTFLHVFVMRNFCQLESIVSLDSIKNSILPRCTMKKKNYSTNVDLEQTKERRIPNSASEFFTAKNRMAFALLLDCGGVRGQIKLFFILISTPVTFECKENVQSTDN